MKLSKASLATFKGIFIALALIMLGGSPVYADADVGEAYYVFAKYLSGGGESPESTTYYQNDYSDNFVLVMKIDEGAERLFAIGENYIFGLNASGGLEWVETKNVDWMDITLLAGGDIGLTGFHKGMTIQGYDADGEFRWEKKNNDSMGVAVASDGNSIYAIGKDDETERILIDKLTLNGEEIWTEYFQSQSDYIEPNDAAVDTEDNVYIVGYYEDIWDACGCQAIKYDSNGDFQWTVTYDSNDMEDCPTATSVAVDDAGFVYVSGFSEKSGFITLQYSADGGLVWSEVFQPSHTTNNENEKMYWVTGTTVKLDGEGGVYIYGSYTGNTYYLMKYNILGERLWSIPIEDNFDYGYDLALCPDGSAVIPNGPGIGYSRYDGDGELIAEGHEKPESFLRSRCDSIAVDSDCNVFAGGCLWNDYDNDDDDDQIDDDSADDDEIANEDDDDNDDDDAARCCG